MEQKNKNILSFSFQFASEDSKMDALWNDNEWESFHDVLSVPLVGDVIDFSYVFALDYVWKQDKDRLDGFEGLLNDYNAVHFKVIKRTYCPFSNHNFEKRVGHWCFYYLTITPILGEDLSSFYKSISLQRERLKNDK